MSSEDALTRRQLKELASVADTKGRRRTGLFMAEGTKCVLELIPYFRARYVLARTEWIAENRSALGSAEAISVNGEILNVLTNQHTSPQVIAYFDLPEAVLSFDPAVYEQSLVVALDRLQDPGNLGTILRTCDWLGVKHVLASFDTADVFNPKTVQATMGAIARVKVCYCDLPAVLGQVGGKVEIFGTFLDGESIYTMSLPTAGVIVMGNEGNGISDAVACRVTKKILIPPYPADAKTVESLNVASATAIVLSQFRSR